MHPDDSFGARDFHESSTYTKTKIKGLKIPETGKEIT